MESTTEIRAGASGPLRVCAENPRYFADATGRPVLLTGSHTWDNVQDMGKCNPPEPFNFETYLDFLQRHGHNFTRLWHWELTCWSYDGELTYCQPMPWPRTGPGAALDGGPKFDLAQPDPEYYGRLRDRCAAAQARGIYTSVMLFEGHGKHSSRPPWCWDGHPFNARNNINGIDGDRDGDDRGLETLTLALPDVLAIQEAHVRQVIDTLNDLDNVLYEVANESGAYSTEWQYHFIRFIKDYEATLLKQHPVGMTFQWERDPAKCGTNEALWAGPADWVSPGGEGAYYNDPPANDGSKVVLSDTDHEGGIAGSQAWVWKTFCRGLQPIFMDPYLNCYRSLQPQPFQRQQVCAGRWRDHLADAPVADPPWAPVRRSMGYVRACAEQFDLAHALPHGEVSSTGYCLAEPGRAYLVYNPAAGPFTVTLPEGEFEAEWLNPSFGERWPGNRTQGGGVTSFTPPFDGDAVLFLAAAGRNARQA